MQAKPLLCAFVFYVSIPTKTTLDTPPLAPTDDTLSCCYPLFPSAPYPPPLPSHLLSAQVNHTPPPTNENPPCEHRAIPPGWTTYPPKLPKGLVPSLHSLRRTRLRLRSKRCLLFIREKLSRGLLLAKPCRDFPAHPHPHPTPSIAAPLAAWRKPLSSTAIDPGCAHGAAALLNHHASQRTVADRRSGTALVSSGILPSPHPQRWRSLRRRRGHCRARGPAPGLSVGPACPRHAAGVGRARFPRCGTTALGDGQRGTGS
jgi:hypothetical protein